MKIQRYKQKNFEIFKKTIKFIYIVDLLDISDTFLVGISEFYLFRFGSNSDS